MWVQVAENYSVNLDQAERVAVHVVKDIDPTITDSPVPAQNVTRVDVAAYFPGERKCVLASFRVSAESGPLEAEAKADMVFARLMRAAGNRESLVDLTQSVHLKAGVPAFSPSVPPPAPKPPAPNTSPIRFAL